MVTVTEAMIVAGGAGTRLRPLTDHTPKPLVHFCGEPFLLGVIRRLASFGIRRVLLVVGADTAPFATLAAAARSLDVEVVAVPEPEPLDTAGGVRAALEEVSGPFFVLNGDILTDVDLGQVARAHAEAQAAATLVLTRVEDTSTFGVCVCEGSRIVGFVEKPAPGTLPGQDRINAGTYLLEPAAMQRFPVGRLSFEREVFPGLVAAGEHLEGVVWDGAWADLGTPDRLRAGHRLALDGKLAWPSLDRLAQPEPGRWQDLEVHLAAGVEVRTPVLLGAGCHLDDGAGIGPHTVLGAGVRVDDGAQLRDTVVLDGARIGAGAVCDGAIIGPGAVVGAHARLDADTVVGEGAVVAPHTVLAAGQRVRRGGAGGTVAGDAVVCED